MCYDKRMKIIALVSMALMACATTNSAFFVNKKAITEHARFVKQCSLPAFVGYHDTIPGELRPKIVSALTYWNDASGMDLLFDAGLVDWVDASEQSSAFILIALGNDETMKKDGLCGAAKFAWDSNGCVRKANILVNSDCLDKGPEVFETTVRHELGHVLGLKHSENFTDLMYFAIESTMQHPVDASAQELSNLTNLYKNNGVCDGTGN